VATECERKFIVDAMPPGVVLDAGVHLRQGYLAEENGVVLRVRIMTDREVGAEGASSAVITVKAGGGLSRTEVEVAIPVAEAEQLWPHTAGRRLEKVRHRVPLGAHVAELDVYEGTLAGLLTVEVEFDSEAEAHRFVPPSWFGRDVTDQPEWSNAALARHGVPRG
jgi:CYTH domain-containing protein